ncbi:endonuclease III [Candidatus Epulonipiscioides gigas]|nr:endonuclease III [Epulopiscium sp. SCG-C07WGA-EpuloA2]
MTLKEHTKQILKILDISYPKDIKCYLNYTTPFELLVATILSAQCKDDRVNVVTESLFKKYTDTVSFANADLEELQQDIKIIGFHKNKAQNIIKTANMIVNEYNGQVPDKIEDLIRLAGVGRKTANVILGNIYKIPSIVVDTHVKRISNRWGLTKNEDPTKIEYDLMNLLPKDHWIRYNTQVIAHGRNICTARNPKCKQCMFITSCPYEILNLYKNLPDETK